MSLHRSLRDAPRDPIPSYTARDCEGDPIRLDASVDEREGHVFISMAENWDSIALDAKGARELAAYLMRAARAIDGKRKLPPSNPDNLREIGEASGGAYNLNDMAVFTLTDYGAQAWREHLDRLGVDKEARHLFPGYKAGEVIRLPLWELGNAFGRAMFNGAPGVIAENNRIRIERSS